MIKRFKIYRDLNVAHKIYSSLRAPRYFIPIDVQMGATRNNTLSSVYNRSVIKELWNVWWKVHSLAIANIDYSCFTGLEENWNVVAC